MAAPQLYGGIELTPQELAGVQNAPSPDLQFANLDAIARTRQLDEDKRKALFQFSGTKDYTKVSPLETFFNALANSATSGLVDLPTNPNQLIPETVGNFAGGLGSSIGLTAGGVGLAGALRAPMLAPFVPGAVGFGQGVLESLDEAQDAGYQFNPIAGLMRGVQSGALNYLPGVKQLQNPGVGKIAGQLLKNAGIAGASEVAVSPLSQLLTYGEVIPQRVVTDIGQQVGAQLGGDAFEGFTPRSRAQAFDTLKGMRGGKTVGADGKVILQGGVQVTAPENVQQFNNLLNNLEAMYADKKKRADSFRAAEISIQEIANQASQFERGTVERAALRQQERTLRNWVRNKPPDVSKDVENLNVARQALMVYEQRKDVPNIERLYRAARKGVGEAPTQKGKETALALEQEALASLNRLGVDPTAPKPVKEAKITKTQQEIDADKVIKSLETLEGQYNLVQSNEKATRKDYSSINSKARAIETNPKAPEWVREYGASLRRETDADLARLDAEKAISEAKARTSAKANQQEKPVGLASLKKDIQERSAEAAKTNKAISEAQQRTIARDEKALAAKRQKVLNDLKKDIEQRNNELVGLQKSIDKAKDRTTKKELQDLKTSREKELNQLKEDIKARSAEAAANEARQRKEANAAYKKLKADEAKAQKAKEKAERKRLINEQKQAKPVKATVTKQQEAAASAFKNPLDKSYEGMNGKTPRDFEKELDKGVRTGKVFLVDYYAERGGEAGDKPFLTRYVTIEDSFIDPETGLKKYVTVDQEAGDRQTRILFAGPDDSRFTRVQTTNKKPNYVLNRQGTDVINLKTGEVNERAEMQKSVSREATSATQATRQAAFEKSEQAMKPLTGKTRAQTRAIYNGLSVESAKKLVKRNQQAMSQLSKEDKAQIAKQITKKDCD